MPANMLSLQSGHVWISFLTLRSLERSTSSYHGSSSIEGEKTHQFFNKTFSITEIILNVFNDLFFKLSALKISRIPGRLSQKER